MERTFKKISDELCEVTDTEKKTISKESLLRQKEDFEKALKEITDILAVFA
jgi:hypothetical protein